MYSDFRILLIFSDAGILALRIALAAILIAHGLPKLRDIKTTVSNFEMMGFRPGAFWGPLVALLETGGAALILLGWFVQPLALLLAGQFGTILVWKVKKKGPLVGGWELDLLIFAGMLALLTLGGGAYSLLRFFL